MSLQGRAGGGRRYPGPENTPRLLLKPKAPPTGYVDGAWWPHSDDLLKELPDLLAVLSVRLLAVSCVTYNVSEWATAPATLLTGGRAVRLEGNSLQPANTLEVLGINRTKIRLLVVPPHGVDPDLAHETMTAAAAPNNASTVDDLLMISPHDREIRSRKAVTEQRWKADAGHRA
jgi:Family of unknown function (DUF5994)